VIEDDYDAGYRYDGFPVGALQGLAPERVVYAGSASKTLAPALRLGWLCLPPVLLDSATEVKKLADLGTPCFEHSPMPNSCAAVLSTSICAGCDVSTGAGATR
jgi:GntR family transcriptional regulator/MocR family aminotransferase